ncbi:hydrolase [Sphingomonas sp. Root50]|nr:MULTISPECIES: HAD-IA family hydrolase [unclassified Sphingomonas]KQX21609.1 hydrolase [Sphingomonas sp. Root1294]KQY72926.1 hydrolase [Sphingomonas sp. Root50]KRB88281.1 hydrolase [Sphingomonas sp. Root720]
MLYDWNLRQFFEKLVPAHELELFLRDVVTLDWHGQHDAGRPFAETSAELIAAWPRFAGAIAAFGPRFSDTVTGLLPGMGEIVRDLHARGVPLYAITNFSHEFWPPFRTREAALFDLFEDILVSGEVRLVKPDPAIYAMALDRFGLAAGEAIFIDDRADNVAAAEAAGIAGHLFVGAEPLRAALRARGLLPPVD